MRKRIVFLLLSIIYLFNIINGYSQDAEQDAETDSTLQSDALNLTEPPPLWLNHFLTMNSPTAASLGKFGEIPVSYYTGVPNIQIPLYEVKCRDLTLPITLKYHASGIRVEEIPGWVGLGWALDAGGVITRQLKGRPDESANGYLSMDTDQFLSPDWQEDYTLLTQIAHGDWDGEPDIFSYHFAGRSGQFVFDSDGEVHCIPHEKLKIEKTIAGGTSKWTITTEDGTQYVFDKVEANTSTNSDGYYCAYNSSWYLSSIRSSAGSTVINLEYTTASVAYKQKPVERYESHPDINPDPILNSDTQITVQRLNRIVTDIETIEFVTSNRDDALNPYTGLPQEVKLDEIQVKSQGQTKKRFVFSTDYFNSSDPSKKRLCLNALTEISSTGESLPPYKFYYNSTELPEFHSHDVDHWGYYNKASNNTSIPTMWIHSYIPIPPFPTTYYVYWGGNREPNPNYTCASVLQKIVYPTGGQTEFTYENNELGWVGREEASGLPLDKLCHAISEATVPNTPVVTTFEIQFPFEEADVPVKFTFELRNATAWILRADNSVIASYTATGIEPIEIVETRYLSAGTYKLKTQVSTSTPHFGILQADWLDKVTSDSRIAGGLRIKQIKDIDAMGGEKVRNFTYKCQDPYTPGVSSGVLANWPEYYHTDLKCDDYGNWESLAYLNSVSKKDLRMTQGSFIGYCDVQEHFGAIQANGYGEYGSNTYRFTSMLATECNDEPIPVDFFFTPTSRDWKRGLLTDQKMYNSNGVVQKEIKNEYIFHDDYSPFYNTNKSIALEARWIGYWNSWNHYLCNNYYAISSWYHQRKQTTITYDANGQNPVSKVVEYYYEEPEHIQLTKTIETNSDGTERIVKMKYPADYKNTSGSSDFYVQAIDSMKTSKHIHDAVIEKMTLEKKSGQSEMVASSELTLYKKFGTKQFLPHKKFLLKNTGSIPLTSFTPLTVSPSGISYDSRYMGYEFYDTYDAFGNILQATDANGIKTSVLYGMKSSMPAAIAANASYGSHSDNWPRGFSYCGFENVQGAVFEGGWSSINQKSTDYSFTGKASAKVSTATSQYGPTLDFSIGSGLQNNTTYVISCWVKTTSTVAQLVAKKNNGTPSITKTVANAICQLGDWKLIEFEYPNIQNWISSDYLRVYPQNNSSTVAYFDDIRVYPKNSKITTLTNDPNNLKLTAQLDDNHMPKYYTYDDFGRLINVANAEGKSINTYNYYYSRLLNGDAFNPNDPNYIRTSSSQTGGFLDEFRNTSSLWTASSGTWSVDNGAYKQASTSNTNTISYRALPQTGRQYYRWKTTFLSGSVKAGLYIMASSNSSYRGNAYFIYQSGNSLILSESVNNVETSRLTVSSGVNASNGETHTYEVMYDPSTGKIEIWRDGKYFGFWTDTSPLTTGAYISLRTNNSSVSFDEIINQMHPVIQSAFVDGLGRDIQQQTWDGAYDNVTKTVYNAIGKVWKEYKPQKLTTTNHTYQNVTSGPFITHTYYTDPLSRPFQLIHPNNATATYSYGVETLGSYKYRLDQLTDEGGKLSKTLFDGLDNKAYQIAGIAGTDTTDKARCGFEYGVLGNVTKIKPPNAYKLPAGTNAWDWSSVLTYNTLGQIVEKNTPDDSTSRYIYDGNGNLKFSQNREQYKNSGDFTVYYYDACNRVKQICEEMNGFNWNTTSPSVSDTTYGKDAGEWKVKYYYDSDYTGVTTNYCRGKLTKVEVNDDSDVDPEYTTKFIYDVFGNVKEKWITIAGASEKKLVWKYDIQGKETELKYPSNNTVAREYDNVGRLKKIYTIP